MYTLVKSFARLNGAGTYWESIDADALPLNKLFSKYRQITVQLHESFTAKNQYLDLFTLKDELSLLTVTLTTWLNGLGNRNLKATVGEIELQTSKFFSYDAITVDFLPKVGNTQYHPSNNIPLDEQTDILLTKPKTNYTTVGKNCLFTVGGYVHPHAYGTQGIYIVGGNSTTLRSSSQEIGILDFSRLGEIEIQPIKEDYLLPPATMLPYRESVYLKLPRTIKTGETLGLVFGGYFHLLDKTYTVIGDNTLKINLQAMNLHSRFFRSRMFLDLSTLEATLDLKDQMSDLQPRELLTDRALKAWMLHPNTFLVYIKADSLQVTQEPLPRPSTPGRYFLGKLPEGAVRADFGELPSFIQTFEPPIWLVSTMWEQRLNTLYETTYFKDNRVQVLNDTPYLHRINDPTLATMMQIRKLALVVKK